MVQYGGGLRSDSMQWNYGTHVTMGGSSVKIQHPRAHRS